MCAVAVIAPTDALTQPIPLNSQELKAFQAKMNRLMRAGLLLGFPIFESGNWDIATIHAWRQFESQYAMDTRGLFAPGLTIPGPKQNGDRITADRKPGGPTMEALQWQVDHCEGPISQMTVPDVPIELARRMFPKAKAETIHKNAPLVAKALLNEGLDHTDMLLLAFATIRAETEKFDSPPEQPNSSGPWNNTYVEDFDVYEPYKKGEPEAIVARVTKSPPPGWRQPARVPGKARNSNSEPGDGAKYKGRGFIQLTGRGSYEEADKHLHLGIASDPDILVNDVYANAQVVAWYIKDHRKNEHQVAAMQHAFARNDLPALRRIFSGGGVHSNPPGMDRFEWSYCAGKQYFREGFAMMVFRRGLVRRGVGRL